MASPEIPRMGGLTAATDELALLMLNWYTGEQLSGDRSTQFPVCATWKSRTEG